MSSNNDLRVLLRLRPLQAGERARGDREVVRCRDGTTVVVEGEKKLVFRCDCALPADASQADVWRALETSLLGSVLGGYNVSLLAYGQTGSGKSYSMFGGTEPGAIPRFATSLFAQLDNDASVVVSMVEIYNERVLDLLTTQPALRVRETPATGAYVQGATVVEVETADKFMSVVRQGSRHRTVAATNANQRSSRAHAIVTVRVGAGRKMSTVTLVDLAGSERGGARLKESGHINKSLMNLALVICAVADGKRPPYRDATLTHLLRDSIGGNARTAILATASVSSACYAETLSTLRYMERAKCVVNDARRNEVQVGEHEALVNALRAEVLSLKKQLARERSLHDDRPRLVVLTEAGRSSTIALKVGETTVGGENAQVDFGGSTQAVLTVHQDGVVFVGPRTGPTRHNGRVVDQVVRVAPNDRLVFGDSRVAVLETTHPTTITWEEAVRELGDVAWIPHANETFPPTRTAALDAEIARLAAIVLDNRSLKVRLVPVLAGRDGLRVRVCALVDGTELWTARQVEDYKRNRRRPRDTHLGVACLRLEPLASSRPVDGRTPVLDCRGQSLGFLHVEASIDETSPPFLKLDITVSVDEALFPRDDLLVLYQWYDKPVAAVTTHKNERRHSQRYICYRTPSLVSYLTHGRLYFEVRRLVRDGNS